MTQTTQYVVKADAKQAKAEIASLETQMKVSTVAAVRMGQAVDRAGGASRNIGMAALDASRALEDMQYGISGVVNNIPSLVMSLGGTAGLTAAISLTAIGVNQLVKNMTAVDPATKEATKKAAEHVKGLRDEIDGLAKDLRALQVGAERAAMEAQGAAVQRAAEAARAALDPLGGIDRFERLKDRTDLPLTIKENVEKARKAMSELDMEMAKLAGMRRIQLEKEAQREIDLAVDLANAKTEIEIRNAKTAEKVAEDLAKTRYDIFVAGLDDEDKALREVAKARAADAKKRREEEARELARSFREMDQDRKAIERDEKERTRIAQRAAKERARIREQEAEHARRVAEDQARYITGATLNTVSILAEGAVMAAQGQEEALAMVLSALSREAGGFITLKGAEVFSAGVAGALLGNPAAPGQIAGGLGLIAAGAAVTAGGPAVASSLFGSGGGSASMGSTGSTGRSDPGASPGRSTGGSGGPMIINVSYGAGGPLPEDIGREIAKAVGGTNRRRGGR